LSGVAIAATVYSLDLAARGGGAAAIEFVALLTGGLAFGVVTVRHLRRHPHPMLDLSLFRLPTFAVGIWGGMFFRSSAGSIPFLLPVFLQVGLGMTAFVAGLLIFADALGNIAMNAFAPAVLRRWGFRTVIVYNGVASAAAMAVPALMGVATPAWVIFAAFLGAGLVRSLQYNALSTLQYAEVDAARMSAATSFASMTQQLCSGTGIAAGAVLMQLALLWRGAGADQLAARDVRVVFVAIALFSLMSIAFYRRLDAHAGAEVSGHRIPDVKAPVPSGD
jgi:Na+/melibiose symporter-like transporter